MVAVNKKSQSNNCSTVSSVFAWLILNSSYMLHCSALFFREIFSLPLVDLICDKRLHDHLWPTWPATPNVVWISQPFFPEFVVTTNRQTDRPPEQTRYSLVSIGHLCNTCDTTWRHRFWRKVPLPVVFCTMANASVASLLFRQWLWTTVIRVLMGRMADWFQNWNIHYINRMHICPSAGK